MARRDIPEIKPLPGETAQQAFLRTFTQQVSHYGRAGVFEDPDPVRWMERHFRIPETPDNLLKLHPYQKAVLWEALMPRRGGDFPYSIVVWSDIKKSIKSTIAAAVALWRAWNTPWGSIKIVANDLKQADSRVSFYIRRAIELHPQMRELVKVKPSGYFMEFPNHARIESIPVDPKGEAGGNDDMVVFSELWAANNAAAQRLWTEMTLSPTKFGKSFRWVETYAGFSGESTLLEKLYLQGVVEGERLNWAGNFDPALEIFKNDSSKMLCLWNGTPRLPWQTPEYYAQEEAVLHPMEFLRVHRNQWSVSTSAFVPIEWWDACRVDNLPPMDKNAPVILAADAAVSSDSFGLVMVSGSKGGENYAVRYTNAWRPPRNGKIAFEDVENEILRLITEYNVVELVYDPYQLEDMMGRLKRRLVARVFPFNQGKPRLIADKALFDLIRDRHIQHRGEVDLREHIGNANSAAENDKLRIVKRSELLKIDLAVCLSMAVARAAYWRL